MQSVIEDGVVSAQDKDDVKPAFREKFTAMVVNDVTSCGQVILHLIQHLLVSKYSFMLFRMPSCPKNIYTKL